MNIAALHASWREVVKISDQATQFFYSHLFLTHPEVRDMFPISMAEQRDRFFVALGHIVSNVETIPTDSAYIEQLGRDHRRFDVVAEHYPAAGASLLATLQHFLGSGWTPELAADWEAAYGVVADIMVKAAALSAADTPAFWDAEVVASRRHSVDIALFEVRTNEPYPFRPGQSMAIEVPQRPRVWRYYSPANTPRPDGILELHVELVPGGQVSSVLARPPRPGDTMKIGSPVGNALTISPEHCGNLLLIAGGTGLAPLRAIVQQLDEHWGTSGGAPDVYLFHGVRNRANLYDHDYLTHMSSRPWFTYIPVVSEDPLYAGNKGLVGTVAAEMYWWDQYTAMVCGSPGMVQHAVGELIRTGMEIESIRHEEFTPTGLTDTTQPLEVQPWR
ncbi:MAG: globin domain-containing protein [Rhodococcus sp. (in: high G+C Gram-positive bacteria)]|uniref:globin domain-containing protein n=1 Tax=Rhodococcus sp. TaxID=1831 RepID=UPI003BAF5AFB